MRKRLLLIGLLVIGVALLSGCELLDQIFGMFTGAGTPDGGGTTSPGSVTKVAISYNLEATVSEKPMPTSPVTTSQETVIASFQPSGGTYNATTKTFTATWDGQTGGQYSNTYLEVRLNDTEEYVEYYYARQTQSNVWFAWTYVDEIRGINVLNLNHETDNPRIYQVTGIAAHIPIDLLTYKRWARESEGYGLSNPIEWINSRADIIPSIDNIITITVYR